MGLEIEKIDHVAIIASDIDRALHFYHEILGLPIINKLYREQRQSWKVDLQVDSHTQIELFTFPNPPRRVTNPEAQGLRHLAFSVRNINKAVEYLRSKGVNTEDVRLDEQTGISFTFFRDPDNLPLELYESREPQPVSE